jgi:hypothetical protein
MTPKVREETIKDKQQDIDSFKGQIQQRDLHPKNDESDVKFRKIHDKMIVDLEKEVQELIDGRPIKKKKEKVVLSWTPESKGEMDKSIFEGQPFLTVNVKDTYTERPTKDSIRMYWSIKDDRCEYLVEEKGYVIGVIESVVIGVLQVSGWKIITEGDNEGRVEFEGELLSDHPSIDFTLKDRTVSGPIQYFNYPDDWKDEKES